MKFEKFNSDDIRVVAILGVLQSIAIELSDNGKKAVDAGLEPDPNIEFELLSSEMKERFYWALRNVQNKIELGALIFIASSRVAELYFQQGCLKPDVIPEEFSPMIEGMLQQACISAEKSMSRADGTSTT